MTIQHTHKISSTKLFISQLNIIHVNFCWQLILIFSLVPHCYWCQKNCFSVIFVNLSKQNKVLIDWFAVIQCFTYKRGDSRAPLHSKTWLDHLSFLGAARKKALFLKTLEREKRLPIGKGCLLINSLKKHFLTNKFLLFST